MANNSKVYWAIPIEIAALPNTAKNMVTNNLVKTRFILDKILDHISPGDKVGIKVHVGEAQNTRYLRPDYVREVVEAIKFKGGKPTLIETQGRGNTIETIHINEEYSICVGHRKKSEDHQRIAQLHGYTESITGAPVHFMDGDQGIDRKIVEIDGIHFKEVSVAAGLFNFDKIVVVSHFKGHPLAGFGGALKQLGMGCVTKHNKVKAHFDGNFVVNIKRCDITKCKQECIASCPVEAIKIENEIAVINQSICYGCFRCTLKCPVNRAIKAPLRRNNDEFVECFIDNAKAALTLGAEKFRYINFAIEIPLMCDCVSNASVPVVPDLGIFGSSDPVAIDKACVDAEINAPSIPFLDKNGEWSKSIEQGIEKFSALNPIVDPSMQFNAALKNELGSIDYDLIKI